MTAIDPNSIESIFVALVQMSVDERASALERMCDGNDDLRREVEGLLRFHDTTSGGALDRSPLLSFTAGRFAAGAEAGGGAAAAAGAAEAAALPPNPTASGFTLTSVLGAGGMGVVYLAEQHRPRRTVALKVLRQSGHGTSRTSVLRRFEYEAEVLARLQHPGIAQIFEAGVADFGHGVQPFIAMELVPGKNLLQYAHDHNLTVRKRLELIAAICDALQHAHQRGVIHRDLKPANILVADPSGPPIDDSRLTIDDSPATGRMTGGGTSSIVDRQSSIPKILDFGVARVLDADIRTTTLQTGVGQLIGTLAYMSPEQVAGDPGQIDTRSDVYAIGVIMYELLTGQPPYRLHDVPMHEAARIIRDHEPLRLSTMNRTLRGDVETIALKALEKDKTRRYQSAAELADDIRRHLSHEPIIARPASALYQIRKFAQRNKIAVAAAVAITLTLAVGFAGTTRGMVEARSQRDDAIRNARIAQAVNDFINHDLLAKADPLNEPDRDITLRDVIDRSAQHVDERFAGDPHVAAAIHLTIGQTYRGLGLLDQARHHLNAALELRRSAFGGDHDDTALVMNQLGEVFRDSGEYDQSLAMYHTSLDMMERLHGLNDVRLADALAGLGLACQAKGVYPEAERLLRRSLDLHVAANEADQTEVATSQDNLAGVLTDMGRHDEAEGLYRAALATRRALKGEDHYVTLHSKNNLAVLLTKERRFDEAEPLYREALASLERQLGAGHSTVGACHHNLADFLRRKRDLAGAEREYRIALDIFRAGLGDDHDYTLMALNGVGEVLMEAGNVDDAEPFIVEALERRQRVLGPDHPETLTSLIDRGWVHKARGQFAEAASLYQQAMEGRRRVLGDAHPATITAMNQLAGVQRDSENFAAAEPLYREVLELRRRTLDKGDRGIVSAQLALADCLAELQRFDDAQPLYAEALTLAEPDSVDAGLAHAGLCRAGCALNQFDDVELHALAAHAILTARFKPDHKRYQQAIEIVAVMYEQTSRPEKAAEWREQHAPGMPE